MKTNYGDSLIKTARICIVAYDNPEMEFSDVLSWSYNRLFRMDESASGVRIISEKEIHYSNTILKISSRIKYMLYFTDKARIQFISHINNEQHLLQGQPKTTRNACKTMSLKSDYFTTLSLVIFS